jgi:MYXO-CTERM domain-containing protein
LAQPADQPSRGTTDTTRAIGTEDDGPDLGWIGLVGLAGLLGLRGRSVDRTAESYSTRQTNPAR